MAHSEKEIESIVKKLMKDIDRKYNERDPFHIEFVENLKIIYTDEIIEKGWIVGVSVEDEQFHHPDGSLITIYLNDETGEISGYQDSSMGRPVPMRAKKESDGKYYLEVSR